MTTPANSTPWTALDTGRLSALATDIKRATALLESIACYDHDDAVQEMHEAFEACEMDTIIAQIPKAFPAPLAKDITTTVTDAIAAFEAGDTRAVCYESTHFDNDADGNDHTSHIVTFTAGDNTVKLVGLSALIRDTSGYDEEVSYHNDTAACVFYNGEKTLMDNRDALAPALGQMALTMTDESYALPALPKDSDAASARAFLAKTQPLLDALRALPDTDDA